MNDVTNKRNYLTHQLVGPDTAMEYRSQIETSLVSHFLEFVEEADQNKDGKIDFDEWEVMGEFFFSSQKSFRFIPTLLTLNLSDS